MIFLFFKIILKRWWDHLTYGYLMHRWIGTISSCFHDVANDRKAHAGFDRPAIWLKASLIGVYDFQKS